MDDDEVIARLDRQIERPWIRDMKTETLITQSRNATSTYQLIRVSDQSGIVGELLDLLEEVTHRLARHPGQLDQE